MCDCIDQINDQLRERNARIERSIVARDGALIMYGVHISTAKIDTKKRSRPFTLIASFCPFCGQKYEESDHGE